MFHLLDIEYLFDYWSLVIDYYFMETLGQILKKYREEARIKIDQVEIDLKISRRMIIALESDNYGSLPDELYAKNFIKSYAGYLNLDYNKILALYENCTVNLEPNGNIKSKKVSALLTPQKIKYGIIGLLIIALLFYLGLQIKQIFNPPQLIILEPAQNMIIAKNFIEIKGKTEKEARVFINEKEVFLDKDGQFNIDLDLQKGLNMIKITAMKKHSRENTVYREILVQ